MRRLRSWLFRLQPLFRRRKIEAELSEELRSHLEFATEEKIAAGLSPAEAQRAAERELGGLEQIKESWRDQRSLPWLDQLQQDFRAAVRSLRKTPGFTAVALLSLALTIGINTTAFSLVNALLLRPLAPRHDSRLVSLYVRDVGEKGTYRPFSHAEYLALGTAHETFSAVAAWFPISTSIVEHEGLRRGLAMYVSENFFSTTGVSAQLGRFFTPEECRPNAQQRVVVLSATLWHRLGSQPDIVGTTLQINGQPYTVVGVAAAGFNGLNAVIATDCWVPLGVAGTLGRSAFGGPASDHMGTDLAKPDAFTLMLTARLAPQVTLDSAVGRLTAIAHQLPTAAKPRELTLTKLARMSTGPYPAQRDPLQFLACAFLALSLCVLLVAGFNLGNMLLARGADRAKEIALRTALGATRGRIIRQLLTEGLLIAIAGGALGFLCTLYADRQLLETASQLNSTLYRLSVNVRPDIRMFVATASCCLVATLVFSLLPAIKASRVDLVHDLKQQGGETKSNHRLGRFFAWRHVVLMAQIALSLVVIFCATLFIRGARAAGDASLGFDPSNGIVGELDFSLRRTPFTDSQRALSRALDRARAQPGVVAAGATTLLPYGNIGESKSVEPSDIAAQKALPNGKVVPVFGAITADYLDALGVRLLRGRHFTEREVSDPSSAYVAIIDESLARQLYPGGDALGQRLRESGQGKYSTTPTAGAAPEYEVVGICSAHAHELYEGAQPCLYVPLAARPDYQGSIFVQVRYDTGDPAAVAASLVPLRAALMAGDPDLPLIDLTPFAVKVELHGSLWLARLSAIFYGVCGSIALLLSMVGIYGVKAYAVSRRRREIGIRLALGASPRAAFVLIFRQALLQTALALAVGAVIAVAAGRVLGSTVYGIRGMDFFSLGSAAVLLAAAAIGACWLPARRAALVDPILALRAE